MARPERFELPTARFVGTDSKSSFLINQQVKWPALNRCAAERRREPRIAAQTLRYLPCMTERCLANEWLFRGQILIESKRTIKREGHQILNRQIPLSVQR